MLIGGGQYGSITPLYLAAEGSVILTLCDEISFTNNFCFFLNLPVNNELGIVQDGRHEFIIKCFKLFQNH